MIWRRAEFPETEKMPDCAIPSPNTPRWSVLIANWAQRLQIIWIPVGNAIA